MLSLSAAALAQTQGDENGTDQTVAPMIEAKIPSNEERDLIGDIDLGVKILGGIVAILVGLTVLYTFSRRKDKRVPSDGGGHYVENVKSSASSFGDHSPAIKADHIEGGVHITYSGSNESSPSDDSPDNISNFPHIRNPNFTGRVDLLDRLHDALTSGKYAALTAITGLGSVGKTQLALEYAYRHKADYKIIWWVKSEEPSTLAAGYAGLATKLCLPPIENLPDAVEAMRSWLEKTDGWLLVFDNAPNVEALVDYLPRTGTGDVIITSRDTNWGGTAQKLAVDVFSRDESIEFLRNRTGKEDGAGPLADALGDLPLALEQAGAYIEETGITLPDYLKRLQKQQKDVLERGNPSSYSNTVATTWNMSFERVKKESSASADLLNLCAFLAPDNIPKSLLIGGAQHLPEPLATVVVNELKFDDVVAALKRYSLVTVTDDSISVHRLVQAVTRDRLDEDDQKRWAKTAVQLVDGAFPFDSYDVLNWPECSLLLLHALAAAEHAERLEVAPEATGRLLNQAGLYLGGRRVELSEAKSVLERALKIEEQAYGPDHPNVALAVGNLGIVLLDLGDLEGARKCHERALKIEEQAYGPDHTEVARTVNNLGLDLQDLGDLEGARKCQERALKIEEQAYGPDHPNVARTVDNLGNVLRALGDLEGARKCHERALKIFRDRLGEDDLEVARAVNNLGIVLLDLGDPEGARKCHERALKIKETVYGPDHLDVARTVDNLGNVLRALGDLEGARKCHERALKIFRDRLGEDHPDTVIVQNNLAALEREIRGEG